ncbi:MAG: hypothetical protein OJF47_003817 [Nitrospira sp.]|jgi:hypothetical protein|nr:MAG: hypothetical protein OJF47_003817 [Nitrospira sp.]
MDSNYRSVGYLVEAWDRSGRPSAHAPDHIMAFAKWRSRQDADQVRERYKDSETIRLLTPLLARPRERWIIREDKPTQT